MLSKYLIIKGKNGQWDLHFLPVITVHMNELNLKLQEKGKFKLDRTIYVEMKTFHNTN